MAKTTLPSANASKPSNPSLLVQSVMSQARRIDYFPVVGQGEVQAFEGGWVLTKSLAGVPASSICPARGCQALISCRKSRFTFLNSQTPASKLFSSPEHQATFVHPEYLESLACLEESHMLQSQSLCPRPALVFAFTVRKPYPSSFAYPHSGLCSQAAMIPANVGFPTSITQSQFLLDRINNHVKTRMLMNSSIGILTANVNTRPHRRPTPPSNVRSSTPNPNSRITSFIKIAAA